MPGKIISLVNFKGGVGKTTLTVNLAACLAKEHDKKVLIVDLDPQSNSSIWLMGPALWSLLNADTNDAKTSTALFYGTVSKDTFFTPFRNTAGNFLPEFYLCPASLAMLGLEQTILQFCNKRRLDGIYKPGDEYLLLAKAARLLKENLDFDFVLIDCPPNLYYGTCNALCHSDYILIPCIPDTLSTSGLKQMIAEMERTTASLLESRRLRHKPSIVGVAITKFKSILNEHQAGVEIIEGIMSDLRNREHLLLDGHTSLFRDQPIRDYVVHAEAVQECLPLCFYAPGSQAYADVKAFTEALVKGIEAIP